MRGDRFLTRIQCDTIVRRSSHGVFHLMVEERGLEG